MGQCVSLAASTPRSSLPGSTTPHQRRHRWPDRRCDQGDGLQGHSVGHPPRGGQTRLEPLAQGRQAVRAACA
ncbi:dehydrogenase domain protein [Mycobacterium xenopi 4042]|uniref:Dehydrogenase domain protein n=1 Tax=Mycobacterium xenopi 4042 TaxID=1299334 RepID=X8AFN7_MYCXE|nr:dehydrogenase domain protein [Mycobacterium xenopi 4042]